jgi:DNA invertase Pin-like site-specific DNA recombinase
MHSHGHSPIERNHRARRELAEHAVELGHMRQSVSSMKRALAWQAARAAWIYVDHGLTGTNRDRAGQREALAACREGDTLVATKLNRLARSLPDARAIAHELTAQQVRLRLGGSVYDPKDWVRRPY